MSNLDFIQINVESNVKSMHNAKSIFASIADVLFLYLFCILLTKVGSLGNQSDVRVKSIDAMMPLSNNSKQVLRYGF